MEKILPFFSFGLKCNVVSFFKIEKKKLSTMLLFLVGELHVPLFFYYSPPNFPAIGGFLSNYNYS